MADPEIQNELIEIMALQVLWEIVKNIQDAVIYTVLADETADVSNKEQLVLCIRWVDDDINVHEEFIRLHPMPGTRADNIVFVIKDMLLKRIYHRKMRMVSFTMEDLPCLM